MNRDTIRSLTEGTTLTITHSTHDRTPEGTTLTIRGVYDRPSGLTVVAKSEAVGYPITFHVCSSGSSHDFKTSQSVKADYITVTA